MKQTHYRACNLCEAICGLEITLEDNQIKSIKGDPNDPLSRGHICPKALALKDIYHDPNRLKQPVRRTAEGWETISWDEALTATVQGLKGIQAKYGNDAVAIYSGNPSVHNSGTLMASPPFIKAVNTKNRYTATSVDQLPHHFAAWLLFGHPMLMPIPDVDNTDFFVIIGGNPIVSNGSIMTAPDIGKRLHAIQKRGGKVVVIDPRRTETADKADQHIFIRPGSDVYLLLAMVNLIFSENLLNLKHLANFVEDIDILRAEVKDFTPEKAEAMTGIKAETIRELTLQLANTERSVVYGRVGVSIQTFGGLCHWLISTINILLGKLDAPGGFMFTNPAFDLMQKAKYRSPAEYFGRWHTKVRGLPEFMGELPSPALAEEINHPQGIKALVTVAGNPVLSTPNGRQLDDALEQLEFMVAVDIYINETSRHAHIILPPTTGLEVAHYDITFHHLAVRNTAKYSEPLFEKAENQRHDWEILQELFHRWSAPEGTPVRFQNPEIALDFMLQAGKSGLSVKQLKENPSGIDLGALQPCLPERLLTPDNKIHLVNAFYLTDLIRAKQDMNEQVALKEDFDLYLISRRELRDNNSWMHNANTLMKGGRNRCTLLMHPETAKKKGIGNHSQVAITSRVGRIVVPVELSDEMMPDVVCLPHGYGHNRKGTRMDIAQQHAGESINDLTDELFLDKLTGGIAFSGLAVKVMAEV